MAILVEDVSAVTCGQWRSGLAVDSMGQGRDQSMCDALMGVPWVLCSITDGRTLPGDLSAALQGTPEQFR